MLITHDDFNPINIRYGFLTKPSLDPNNRKLSHSHFGSEAANLFASRSFNCKKIALVNQQHTDQAIIINNCNNYETADAQVTNISNIAIGVITADCVPVLLADLENNVIAAAHAGWKGARSGIIKNTIEKMALLGAKKVTAIIGPCIKQASYEVTSEFLDNFLAESVNNQCFFINKQNGRYMFDLTGYVKHKLLIEQIDKIFDINRNTYQEEEQFYSFRRFTHYPEGTDSGDLLSVIMIL
jgi:polyphenol oxidase